jgi:hypothetical protein
LSANNYSIWDCGSFIARNTLCPAASNPPAATEESNMETIAQKNARLRALREARDGTPEEQMVRRKKMLHVQNLRRMARNEHKLRHLVLQLENSMGERLPPRIRTKIFDTEQRLVEICGKIIEECKS